MGGEIIVIGSGLAGLTCAHTLAAGGARVRVLESEDDVGGRTRTDWYEGRPVDRGFQVMFSAYPNVRKLMRSVGIPSRDVRAFDGGAVFHHGDRWHRLGPSPTSLARFGGMSVADRMRLMRLGAELRLTDPAAQLEHPASSRTTAEHLSDLGFSSAAIEEVFRPLFGVVFLDRSLTADAGYFRYLAALLGRGPAALPSDGLGMIAAWTARAIEQLGGAVDTGRRVAEVLTDGGRRVSGVRTQDGAVLHSRRVVLATEGPATSRLLQGAGDELAARRVPGDAASVATAAFALSRPLYRGRAIVLNAAPPDEGAAARVDLVCQTSNVTRPAAVGGPHILLATSVTTPQGGTPAGLEDAVAGLIARWSPTFPWRDVATPLGVTVHEFAQYRPRPGVRDGLPGTSTAIAGLVLAGDLTAHPSIEGAVTSGLAAAETVRLQPE